MTIKATVVYAQPTGHVLGVVTARSDAERKLEAQDLVGDALPLRKASDGDVLVNVAASLLAAKNLDVPIDLAARPQLYAIVDDQPTLLAGTLTTMQVALTRTTLTVTFPAQAPADAKVWALIDGGPRDERVSKTAQRTGTPAPATVTIDVALDPGSYAAFVAVTGCTPVLKTFTVT